MALSKPHRRHRSPSDPFTDSSSFSYSSYGVPTLSRNPPPQDRAPPLPPKLPPKTRNNPRPHTRPAMATEVITTTDRRSNEVPRVRMNRSQTTAPPPQSQSRPQPTPRRSHSQDSVMRAANNVEKAKASTRRAPPTKKGSSHADVIDRLDFSGVGPMFHHDGPFDACAPSRNRHRTRAPMLAWTGAADEDKDAFANAREIPSSGSPYPTTGLYAPYEAPKKKHDAIAEAWGIHEPEPFEDFSAGGGYSAHASGEFSPNASNRHDGSGRRNRDGARERYKEYLEEPQQTSVRRQPTKRSLPPPQPIFVPEAEADNSVLPPSPGGPGSPGAPKRSKSLIHRIRKMRDAPNVPATHDEVYTPERDPSPPSSTENASGSSHAQPASRPTHRSQNSFLGRLGRKAPASPTEGSYAYTRDAAPPITRREKSLPATPGNNVTPGEDDGGNGYFEGGGGLGRKTSLLKKVKGVVKGATNTR